MAHQPIIVPFRQKLFSLVSFLDLFVLLMDSGNRHGRVWTLIEGPERKRKRKVTFFPQKVV